jgi:hypothetical protein
VLEEEAARQAAALGALRRRVEEAEGGWAAAEARAVEAEAALAGECIGVTGGRGGWTLTGLDCEVGWGEGLFCGGVSV